MLETKTFGFLGHEAVVRVLLLGGCDPNVRTNAVELALNIAARRSHFAASYLLSLADTGMLPEIEGGITDLVCQFTSFSLFMLFLPLKLWPPLIPSALVPWANQPTYSRARSLIDWSRRWAVSCPRQHLHSGRFRALHEQWWQSIPFSGL